MIRRFRPGDEAGLLEVYRSAIRLIAAQDYTAEQIQAWAPADMDTDLWACRMREIQPFVAEQGGEIVGYADLQPNGYIDHFFVSGRHARQGIGRRLMQRIHQEANALGLIALRSQVSKTAETFFLRNGFEVVERQLPVRRSVVLQNAVMRKGLR